MRRAARSEYGVQPAQRVPLRVVAGAAVQADLQANVRALQDKARVGDLEWGAADGAIGASAVLRSGTELFIPLEGVIDLERERQRLRTEVQRLDGQAAGTEKKLANESFVSRAPAEVVDHERQKLASLREQRGRLAEKLTALEGAA